MFGEWVIACLLCLLIGAAATWAFLQGALRAQRILAAETLEQRLDEQAVRHALSLEAVRRGLDVAQADENAWQLLAQMRAQMRATMPAAQPGQQFLHLHQVHTVRPASRVAQQGGRSRLEER